MSRLFTLQEVNDLELSAVEAERERIIKLLETTRLDGTWCNPDQYCNHSVTCHEVFDWLGVSIALIKGETK